MKQLIEKQKGLKAESLHLQLLNNRKLILNDEKQLADYGIFNAENDASQTQEYWLSLQINPATILIKVNLSHTLKKYGSFVQKIDTSGGSASFLNSEEVEIKTSPNCSVYYLKYLIFKQTQTPVSD